MRETWRWFGPADIVPLTAVRQAGAAGIVTALHDHLPGQVWSREAIRARKALVETGSEGEPTGLTWDVVESLPVSEAIKSGGPEREAHLAAYIESLKNLAAEGLSVICYNFMPILDWTRTDLAAPRPSGATALRFDLVDFAAWDVAVLKREGAIEDVPAALRETVIARSAAFTDAEKTALTANILAGLPGAMEHWTAESVKDCLATYADIGRDALRDNLAHFLRAVVPTAERLGMRLCCHPDDPPWPLLGLPRIVSTAEDYRFLIEAAPSPANGVTFCTGSLGARPDNDLPAMIRNLGPHIHFLHLRNVFREDGTVPGSFFEDDHLAGSTDMVDVLAAVAEEEARRRDEGRADHTIPMRPDHGQDMLDDLGKGGQPGYPAIGRLKGLAELRGVMAGLTYQKNKSVMRKT